MRNSKVKRIRNSYFHETGLCKYRTVSHSNKTRCEMCVQFRFHITGQKNLLWRVHFFKFLALRRSIQISLPNPSILLSSPYVIITDFSSLCFLLIFIQFSLPPLLCTWIVSLSGLRFLRSHVTLKHFWGLFFVLFSWQHSIFFFFSLLGVCEVWYKGIGRKKKRLVNVSEGWFAAPSPWFVFSNVEMCF